MKTLRLPAIAIAALLAAASCRKDDATPAGASTLSKIQARWAVASTVYDRPGTEDDETVPGTATDYVDFKTDGKVYAKAGSDEEAVSPYQLISDTKLVIDGDTSAITKLTATEFSFTQTFPDEEAGGNHVITYNLKK